MKAAALAVIVCGCGFSGGGTVGDAAAVASGDGAPASGDAARATDAPGSDAPVMHDAPPPPPHTCAGYTTVAAANTTSTYQKFNTPTTYAMAKARCEQDTARLVIPETTAEATALHAFVNPDGSSPYYWIGVANLDGSGWKTVLGAVFPNPPWGAGQPNDNSGVGAAVLVDASGLFYDFRQDASQEFACECAP